MRPRATLPLIGRRFEQAFTARPREDVTRLRPGHFVVWPEENDRSRFRCIRGASLDDPCLQQAVAGADAPFNHGVAAHRDPEPSKEAICGDQIGGGKEGCYVEPSGRWLLGSAEIFVASVDDCRKAIVAAVASTTGVSGLASL